MNIKKNYNNAIEEGIVLDTYNPLPFVWDFSSVTQSIHVDFVYTQNRLCDKIVKAVDNNLKLHQKNERKYINRI